MSWWRNLIGGERASAPHDLGEWQKLKQTIVADEVALRGYLHNTRPRDFGLIIKAAEYTKHHNMDAAFVILMAYPDSWSTKKNSAETLIQEVGEKIARLEAEEKKPGVEEDILRPICLRLKDIKGYLEEAEYGTARKKLHTIRKDASRLMRQRKGDLTYVELENITEWVGHTLKHSEGTQDSFIERVRIRRDIERFNNAISKKAVVYRG